MGYLMYLYLLFLLAITSKQQENIIYKVNAIRVNKQGSSTPQAVISKRKGNSIWDLNYNAGVSRIIVNGSGSDILFVRSQNYMNNKARGEPVPHPLVTKSVIPVLKLVGGGEIKIDNLDNITFQAATQERVGYRGEGYLESYGVEDARVVYREKDKYLYMMYSAVENDTSSGEVIARLALAKTRSPDIWESWERVGVLFPRESWSKSGALIIRDEEGGPHYLFWGGAPNVAPTHSHQRYLRVSITYDLITYFTLPHPSILTPREDMFDSAMVESGPPPLKLEDGNYLFIYNSARTGYPCPTKPNYDKQYNIGYLILHKDDPTRILQRSQQPLLTPTLKYEKQGLVCNVVFCNGAKSLGGDQFLIYYGGADSVLYAALVTITHNST